MKLNEKSFIYTILDFTQSHPGALGDIDGFVQKIPGIYESQTPVNIIGTDEIHSKRDCVHGSIVNGFRERVFYSFPLDQPPGHKNIQRTKNQTFGKCK